MNVRRAIVAAVLFLAASVAGAADPFPAPSVSFFVSARSTVRNLPEGDLRRIFLGEISRWPSGRRIVLYVRPFDSPSGRLFLDRLMRMPDIDYAQWWLGAVFRGRAAAAPRVMESHEAMARAVATNVDAIGFDSSSSLDPDLVIVTIDGRMPSDPRYPIRAR